MDQRQQNTRNLSKNKIASDEKSRERELWFKTVVKVLNWKDGLSGGKKQVTSEKISKDEWIAYCQQTLKINANTLRSKTMQKLHELEEVIKKHGGFA